jgi:hypothetical protein
MKAWECSLKVRRGTASRARRGWIEVLEIWAPGWQGFWESKWLASALVAGTSTRLNSIGDRFSLDTDLTTWLEWRESLRDCFEIQY